LRPRDVQSPDNQHWHRKESHIGKDVGDRDTIVKLCRVDADTRLDDVPEFRRWYALESKAKQLLPIRYEPIHTPAILTMVINQSTKIDAVTIMGMRNDETLNSLQYRARIDSLIVKIRIAYSSFHHQHPHIIKFAAILCTSSMNKRYSTLTCASYPIVHTCWPIPLEEGKEMPKMTVTPICTRSACTAQAWWKATH
jgi:hypothetical protein